MSLPKTGGLGKTSGINVSILSKRDICIDEVPTILSSVNAMCLRSRIESISNLQQVIEQKVLWSTSNFSGSPLTPLKGGVKCKLTFSNDYSRKIWIYFIKNRSDVFRTVKQWKVLIEGKRSK